MAWVALCAIGLTMIYSTTGGPGRIYWTQFYAIGLGLIAMLVCMAIDYRSLADKSHFLYLGIVTLLVFVLFFGVVRGGSQVILHPIPCGDRGFPACAGLA